MTEAPKKPRRKARADASADAQSKKRADASADAQTKKPEAPRSPRDDQQMREAVLAAALPHAAFDVFTDSVLEKAGAQAGVAKNDLARLFENGPLSLVEFYSTHTDAELEKRLAG